MNSFKSILNITIQACIYEYRHLHLLPSRLYCRLWNLTKSCPKFLGSRANKHVKKASLPPVGNFTLPRRRIILFLHVNYILNTLFCEAICFDFNVLYSFHCYLFAFIMIFCFGWMRSIFSNSFHDFSCWIET